MTENGSPSRVETTPGGAVDERRRARQAEPREVMRLAGDRLPRRGPRSRRLRQRADVGAQHDVRVEHREQRLEVAVARGGEERVDHLALACRDRRPASVVAPWTRRRARLASCRAASGERSTIGAISSKGTANMSCSTNASRSAGVERLQHDEQREPDRVGQQRLVLGVGAVGAVDDRLGHVDAQRLLAPRVARAQHVQADARDDGRQPAAEVLDVARVGAAEPQPGLLDGVVGLAERAEHPVGHRPQVGPVRLEPLRQPVALVHRSHSSVASGHSRQTRRTRAM